VNIRTQLYESVVLTFKFLRAHKLRSFLSVLGVTIGIFCIVAILTATHSLEQNIRSNIDKLGDKIVYVQKWPWMFGGSYQWWDYLNRPETTLPEYKRLRREGNTDIIKSSAFYFEFQRNKVKSIIEELSSVKVVGVTGDFFEINQWEIEFGRKFTEFESQKGKNVAIIGYNLAVNLFQGQNPVGKDIKINGSKVSIIGILEFQGNSIGGQQYDDIVILPGVFAERFAKPNTAGVGSAIIVKGYEHTDLKDLSFEIKRVMRSMRKLRPKDDDDFAINKLTMFSDSLSQTFGMINIAGWIIGGFSLLVGGFGIANIMFVSVKERTSIIGLQKSLGAKKKFILSQFLFEAVFLCIVGATIGILITLLSGLVLNTYSDFKIYYSLNIMIIGIITSVIIGLIAGLAPARKAARMNPVVAIRK
jgi:putative ABC transport system permease protein